jgi:hypothetical protein
MKALIVISFLAASLLLVACGDSAETKAQKQVCSARSDLQKQVKELQGLTLATATTNGVKDSLNAIRDDLSKIKDAQGQLGAQRKKEVQSANDEFVSQFQSIASDLGTNLSLSDAQSKLQAAVQKLAAAYRGTFAKIDCSS